MAIPAIIALNLLAKEHGLGIFEFTMTELFPYVDIERDDEPGVIYLRRFLIYPRDKDFGKNKGKGRIYLHKFYLGDSDPHLHDHPWRYTSLILTRGYWEETPYDPTITPATAWTKGDDPYMMYDHGVGELRIRKFYRRLSVLRRPAVWRHRVILKDKTPVWTIVRTGVKERSWGFWLLDKFCPWRQYNNGVCYCTPEEKTTTQL